ncbi:membrane or secreted protein [gut metagenome]|uniref:Membrane or secreted protein n=1 Tax=gut metagenome TaxID=749906 RepID=J9G4R5_9ZZZZ
MKVGSSSANFNKAVVIFSWSAFVFGSTATLITGSGNTIFSKMNDAFSSANVSPVVVFLKPTAAAISPA